MLIIASIACVQDCMGGTVWVTGYVVDAATGTPIHNATIRVWNNGSFEVQAFNLNATSNSEGYFETDSAFSYACTAFQVQVSAEGYASTTLTFYPPTAEGWKGELPSPLRVELQPL